MVFALIKLQLKLAKYWAKLLKAETKRNEEKVAKFEQKLIETELKIRQIKESK